MIFGPGPGRIMYSYENMFDISIKCVHKRVWDMRLYKSHGQNMA